MLEPTLTIITVSAFDEIRLKKTLNSISNYLGDFEHLVVIPKNDIESLFVLESFSSNQSYNLRVIHDENKGIYQAMNIGIANASGKYVCFWNAGDELYSKSNLTNLIRRVKEEHPEWVICQGNFDWREKMDLSFNSLRSFVLHCSGSFISHQCCFFLRNSLIVNCSFNTNYKIAADTELITRFFLRVKPLIEESAIVRVENPNFARKNHRIARIESIIIALFTLKKTMRIKAIQNIIYGEIEQKLKNLSTK